MKYEGFDLSADDMIESRDDRRTRRAWERARIARTPDRVRADGFP